MKCARCAKALTGVGDGTGYGVVAWPRYCSRYCMDGPAIPMPPPRLDQASVDRPPHYEANGIEAVDVIEAFGLGFHLGNTIKYVLRADRKGTPIVDLKKAIWYLQREVERRSK